MFPISTIAIVGGSGSGKSWLARRIRRAFSSRAAVLCLDDFYADLSEIPKRERTRVNFDNPDAIDWRLFLECVKQIAKGETPDMPVYDFTTHTRFRRVRKWKPRPVVLVEGLWLLHKPELRRVWDLSIFMDCPEDIRLARRIERDQQQRGRSRISVVRQFCRDVVPMHNLFVDPQRDRADVVLGPDISSDALAKLLKKVQKISCKDRT